MTRAGPARGRLDATVTLLGVLEVVLGVIAVTALAAFLVVRYLVVD